MRFGDGTVDDAAGTPCEPDGTRQHRQPETVANARRLATGVCPVVDRGPGTGATYSAWRHAIGMPPIGSMKGRTIDDRETAWCSVLMHEVGHAVGSARLATMARMLALWALAWATAAALATAAGGAATWGACAGALAAAMVALLAIAFLAGWHESYEEMAAELAGQRIERRLGWSPEPSWRRDGILRHAMRLPEAAGLRRRTMAAAARSADRRAARALRLFEALEADGGKP